MNNLAFGSVFKVLRRNQLALMKNIIDWESFRSMTANAFRYNNTFGGRPHSRNTGDPEHFKYVPHPNRHMEISLFGLSLRELMYLLLAIILIIIVLGTISTMIQTAVPGA